MDGYAVRAADVTHASVRLQVIGEVAAGRPFEQTVGPDQAARIFTGGVVPAGADTVVIQEFTKRNGDWVEIQGPTARGRHIRMQGLDFKEGCAATWFRSRRRQPDSPRHDPTVSCMPPE